MAGKIRLYYAYIGNVEPEGDYPLSAYRRERLGSMSHEESRRQGVAAELLLNKAVRDIAPDARLPLSIEKTDWGRPYLTELPYYFSLSHSGDIAACAFAERGIGLDIQRLSSFNEKLINRRFSPEERDYILRAPDRDLAFTEIWAGKESYIKALGLGLRLPLSSFSVVPELSDSEWKLKGGIIEGLCFSICIRRDDDSEIEIIKENL